MAYREVGIMDTDQVIRRWLGGEKIRAIARSTGLDRNTIRRIVRAAEEVGVQREMLWPDDDKLQAITAAHRSAGDDRHSRLGRAAAPSPNQSDSSLAGQRPPRLPYGEPRA